MLPSLHVGGCDESSGPADSGDAVTGKGTTTASGSPGASSALSFEAGSELVLEMLTVSSCSVAGAVSFSAFSGRGSSGAGPLAGVASGGGGGSAAGGGGSGVSSLATSGLVSAGGCCDWSLASTGGLGSGGASFREDKQ